MPTTMAVATIGVELHPELPHHAPHDGARGSGVPVVGVPGPLRGDGRLGVVVEVRVERDLAALARPVPCGGRGVDDDPQGEAAEVVVRAQPLEVYVEEVDHRLVLRVRHRALAEDRGLGLEPTPEQPLAGERGADGVGVRGVVRDDGHLGPGLQLQGLEPLLGAVGVDGGGVRVRRLRRLLH
jgi:hypothetical protein